MKLEMDYNTSSTVVWVAGIAAVAGIIFSLIFFVHDYNVKENATLASAKTCEELVVLQGGSDVTNKLMACKLQPQPLTPVNQSGK